MAEVARGKSVGVDRTAYTVTCTSKNAPAESTILKHYKGCFGKIRAPRIIYLDDTTVTIEVPRGLYRHNPSGWRKFLAWLESY